MVFFTISQLKKVKFKKNPSFQIEDEGLKLKYQFTLL
jgi:hypothetical protein